MSPEIIEAISKLWLLALILLIIIFIILFQNQIRKLLASFTNFRIKGKHKDTELELESSFKEKDNSLDLSEQISSQESSKSQKDDLNNLDAKHIVEDDNDNIKKDISLFNEMILVLEDEKDLSKGQDIYDRIQESESDSSKKVSTEAVYRYFSYKAGDVFALEKLEKLCDKTENQNAYYWLAKIYELTNNLIKAIEVYEIAAEKNGSESDRASNLRNASKCYFKLGNEEIAFNRLQMELSIIKSTDGLSEIYQGLADLYDFKNDWDLKAIALDKVSEYKANDTNIIFKTAYSYNKSNLNHLALTHYNLTA